MPELAVTTPFFLILRAAGYSFALPGTAVRGVLEASGDSSVGLGGFGGGGGDLTYLDAHQVFRGGRSGGRFAKFAAVIESGDRRVALGIDTPGRVTPSSDATVVPFPALLRRPENRMVAGFLRTKGELAVLLDPERLAEMS